MEVDIYISHVDFKVLFNFSVHMATQPTHSFLFPNQSVNNFMMPFYMEEI